jgi:GNAT superfamily N-acetyltransferase
MRLDLKTYSGAKIIPFLDDLARLRIEVFREWPYLYEGDLDYEKTYLEAFRCAENSVMVIAFDGESVVGASTGMPMIHESEDLREPLRQRGYDLERCYYFSESVLIKPYRGRGTGKQFFAEREKWVKGLETFNLIAFCGVTRPEDHPLRPRAYQSLDAFWRRLGYEPTDIFAQLSWKDVDEKEESLKPLRYWMKQL